MARIQYQYECGRRVRCGFVGCGGHSYRNIFPTFQYVPVDLVAVCDLDPDRAKTFARMFGASRHYTDYHEMFSHENLEAVFVVTNYDESGRPQVAIVRDALEAGCHVWMEKPPASSVAEVEELRRTAVRRKRFVLVGFKKIFFPAVERAKSVTEREEFGGPTSGCFRYPQQMPSVEEKKRGLRDNPPMVGFLDHIVHPLSAMNYLLGPFTTLYYRREPRGGACAVITHEGGIVSTLHLAWPGSGQAPLERLEITGHRACVVVDNGVRLIYYRPGVHRLAGYGREADFLGDDASAPIIWEPEFSLGQIYNKQLFLLGYWGEVNYFLDCVLRSKEPERAGLDDALMVMKGYEAFLRAGEGEEVQV